MKRILLLAFCTTSFLVLFAQNYCIKNRFGSTALYTDAQIRKDSNIVYGVAKRWNANIMDTLRMDIYSPDASVDNLAKRPLIVFAFGGGFLGGNRSEMAYLCREFSKRGFVTATIDYRLGWNCASANAAVFCLCSDYISLYNATYFAMQDYNASLRFLSFKSSQYKIDTNFVFVSGGSAGSITAMNAAFTSQAEIDSRLSWVHKSFGSIDSSGNLHPKNYKIKGVLDFCGAVYDTAFMTNNADIPIVSFHDSVDCVVNTYRDYLINCTGNCQNLFPMDGSAIIYRKALKNNTCAELNINPVVGHCTSNLSYLINHGSCFLKRVLCNSCVSSRTNNQNVLASCDSLGSVNGIAPHKNDKGLMLYPNPATDILNFELGVENLPAIITIYDLNGKQVLNQTVSEGIGSIRLNSFGNGIYLVKVQTPTTIQSEKIVIYR